MKGSEKLEKELDFQVGGRVLVYWSGSNVVRNTTKVVERMTKTRVILNGDESKYNTYDRATGYEYPRRSRYGSAYYIRAATPELLAEIDEKDKRRKLVKKLDYLQQIRWEHYSTPDLEAVIEFMKDHVEFPEV